MPSPSLTIARLVGALAVVLVVGATTPHVAGGAPLRSIRVAEEDGLTAATKVTYRFDPAAPAVVVDMDLSITNDIAPVTRGDVVESAYFTGYGVGVPVDAAGLVATTGDGRTLSVRTEETGSRFVTGVLIDFGRSLYHRDTISFRFSYSLPATAPRSEGLSRVNGAFATFPVFAYGDPGRTSVEVQVPSRFEVSMVGSEMERTERDGMVIYAAPDADPETFWVDVIARDDTALVTEEIDLDPGTVLVRAWPGDQAWADFASEQVREGVPALEELIGLPWPRDDDTEVIETNTPYLYGYAGWFEPVNGVIEIGDRLDQIVILHELTHRWFNDQLFATRWINEGLAEEMSAQAMAELGGDPEPSALPPESDPGHQPLNTWSDPRVQSDRTEEQEAYGYAASYAVVHELVDAMGEDATRLVLRNADADRIAYQGDAEAERHVGQANWRYFLDLVEQLGGAEGVDLFEDVVVDEDGGDDLDDRAAARTAYDELVEAGDRWAPPLAVRRAMAGWRFDEAEALMDASEAALRRRAQLAHEARSLGLREPGTLEPRYEGAEGDLGDIDRALDGIDGALGAIAAAEEAVDEGGPLAEVGGLLSSADDDLAEARAAFAAGDTTAAVDAAEQAQEAADAEAGRGAAVLGGLLVLVVVAAGAAVLLVRRSRRQPAPAPAPSPEDWGRPPPL